MRVLVCGGRNFLNKGFIFNCLEELNNELSIHAPGIETIIHGDAKGVDRIAGGWAYQHGIKREVYPADWDKYGKAAGYIRNAKMLKEGHPDLIVAFPGGVGTAMMVKIAKKAGIQVMEVS